MFEDFGSDDNDCVLVIEADDVFSPSAVRVLRAIVTDLRGIEGVESVHSLADAVTFADGPLPRMLLPAADASPEAYETARTRALRHPLLKGQLLSEDARTTLVLVRLAGGSLSAAEIEPRVAAIRQIAAHHTRDTHVRVRLTGLPPIRVEVVKLLRAEQLRFGAVGSLLGLAMAILIFRRAAAVCIVLCPVMLGTFWTLGALGLAGEKINLLNNVLPTLVMVIAFSDAVHLVFDMRRSRAAGASPREAARSAIRHLVVPCGLTSLTTAIGFCSLAAGRLDIIQRLGLAFAAGVLITFVAVLTIVPLLGSTRLGSRIHRGGGDVSRAAPFFDFVAGIVVRHARIVAVLGTVGTILLAASALRLRPDNRLLETIPPGNESYAALLHCNQAFGGVLLTYALIEWSEQHTLESPRVWAAIEEAQALFEAEAQTRYPVSALSLLAGVSEPRDRATLVRLLPREISGRFIRPDRRRALVWAHVTDAGTQVYAPVYERLQAALAEIAQRHEGVSAHLTGSTYVATRDLNGMIGDLAKSLVVAAAVIFLVLTIALRSVRLGLISVLPNVFPLAATSALLSLTGQPLQLSSVIVFSICLGIAVDDTIHFLSRFQREMLVDGDVAGAIRRTLMSVGSALLTTTLVVTGGFATMMLSEMPSLRMFAGLSIVALTAALIGDLLILPALLMCLFGRKQGVAPAGGAPVVKRAVIG